jgi:hypothetical protein
LRVTDVSLPPVPQPDLAPSRGEIERPPGEVAPMPRNPELRATQVQASAVQSGEKCGSCGAAMASDQRYCLACGQRRGDPRLPFMDAVVLMDAVKRPAQAPPPPPRKKRGGISPNAALIAGVGTLLLALGIGVLIGRSGTHEVAQTAAAPQVIKVGGGGEESATGSKSKITSGGDAASAKTKKQKEAALKEAEKHPAAEEILKPAGDVKLPPPTVKPGDKCEQGAAGCENGEFTGNFFGE